jgi:hypothetical protein
MSNWIYKNGTTKLDCDSFPFAFRTAFTAVRKAVEAKQSPASVAKHITILGPKNSRGDRTTYTYDAALQLAKDQGLVTAEGNINSREFKKNTNYGR